MHFDFLTYMEDVATNLKAISHSASNKRFFKVSGIDKLEELLMGLTKVKDNILVIEDNLEGKYGENATSLLDNMYYTFYTATWARSDDAAAIAQAKVTAKSLKKKILAKMSRDKRLDQQGVKQDKGLRNFDRASVYYRAIGPLANGFYGVMVNFIIAENPELTYNVSDWNY